MQNRFFYSLQSLHISIPHPHQELMQEVNFCYLACFFLHHFRLCYILYQR